MIIHWQNQLNAYTGGHRYLSTSVRQNPQHIGITSVVVIQIITAVVGIFAAVDGDMTMTPAISGKTTASPTVDANIKVRPIDE